MDWKQIFSLFASILTIVLAIVPLVKKVFKGFSSRFSWIIIVSSLLIACLVMWGRWQGKLQKWELNAFDHLMRQQPVIGRDKNLLVVSVTQDDIAHLDQPDEETGQGLRSLSDNTLDRLVERLQEHKPRVIGLDIFHPWDVDEEKYPNLKASLRTGSLITVCHFPTTQGDPRRIQAPQDAHKDSIGFANVVPDEDEVIRRHLMLGKVTDINLCKKVENVPSFSFSLALSYLKSKGIKRVDRSNDEAIIFNDGHDDIFKLTPFDYHAGGYHKVNLYKEFKNFQEVINYRPYRSYEDIAQIVSITDVLDPNKSSIAEQAKEKIVLIGRTDAFKEDMFKTPFTTETYKNDNKLPGVLLHAQLVSQIIDAVMKKRPFIWAFPWFIDALWIWLWSLVGGIIVCRVCLSSLSQVRSLMAVVLLGVFAFVIMYLICWGFLYLGGWIPLVPLGLAVFITGVSVAIYTIFKP